MGKTVLYIAMSVDGFIAGKNDDISWLSRYNDVDYGFDEFLAGIGAIIQGRRAYEVELQHGWSYARPLPTFVLSHRSPDGKPLRKKMFFTDESIEAVLGKAKAMTSKDVWIEGGAIVAQQFIARGLVDEFVLSIVPVILGQGIRLFGTTTETMELTLQGIRRYDKGLVQLFYARE